MTPRKPIDGKVYTVPEETNSLVAGKKVGERKLSKAFVDQMFKQGNQEILPAAARKD